MLRPPAAFVHCGRKAREEHTSANLANPPSVLRPIETVTPAGHVTVPSVTLTSRRSLSNRPLVMCGPWILHFASMPSTLEAGLERTRAVGTFLVDGCPAAVTRVVIDHRIGHFVDDRPVVIAVIVTEQISDEFLGEPFVGEQLAALTAHEAVDRVLRQRLITEPRHVVGQIALLVGHTDRRRFLRVEN